MSGSQWVRIDVGYLQNPKVLRAGRDGALLHLAAICYLARLELDDGVLPVEAIPVLAAESFVRHPAPVVRRLVTHGLWVQQHDAYLVHHYDEMNGSYASRTLARERTRRWRQRVAEPRNGDGP